MKDQVRLKLTKSYIGSPENIRATLIGLGLTRMNKTIIRSNTPEIQGMVRKVKHLILVEE